MLSVEYVVVIDVIVNSHAVQQRQDDPGGRPTSTRAPAPPERPPGHPLLRRRLADYPQ
jgi:hypothetical protein